jgi:hypothetical protein
MKLLNNNAESMKEDAQDTEETSKKKALFYFNLKRKF